MLLQGLVAVGLGLLLEVSRVLLQELLDLVGLGLLGLGLLEVSPVLLQEVVDDGPVETLLLVGLGIYLSIFIFLMLFFAMLMLAMPVKLFAMTVSGLVVAVRSRLALLAVAPVVVGLGVVGLGVVALVEDPGPASALERTRRNFQARHGFRTHAQTQHQRR